jgi:uncharacterized membrane protein YhiD involved in acid resistance
VGIGFLGAGMILKGEVDKKITNLTRQQVFGILQP